jgi:hypothetical protein
MEELERCRRNAKKVIQSLVESHQETRLRTRGFFHDQMASGLTALSLQLKSLSEQYESEQRIDQLYQQIKDLQSAVVSFHQTLKDLPIDSNQSLEQQIKSVQAYYQERYPISIHVTYNQDIEVELIPFHISSFAVKTLWFYVENALARLNFEITCNVLCSHESLAIYIYEKGEDCTREIEKYFQENEATKLLVQKYQPILRYEDGNSHFQIEIPLRRAR